MRIVGTVVGKSGAPVAGWVRLGKGAPRRVLGERFRVLELSGREVEVELEAAVVEPVIELRAPWAALERDPLVAPCRADAPGPHVEVHAVAEVVRGGDRVAVWAVETGGRLVAERVARGDGCEERLTRMVAKGPTPARGTEVVEEPSAHGPRWGDRGRFDVVTPLAVAAAAVLAGLGMRLVPGSWRLDLLVLACLVLALPAMMDIAELGFRVVGAPFNPAAIDPRLKRALLLVLALVSGCFMLFSNTREADRREHVANQIFLTIGLGGSHFLMAAIVWTSATTGRRRRRLLGILVRARALGTSPQPDVWGAVEGTAAPVPGAAAPPTVGETPVLVVQGKRWSLVHGGHDRGSWDDSLAAAVDELSVGDVLVRPARGLWCTTVMLGQRVGEATAEGGDVIAAGNHVRVVGRASADGVLAAGGEESLLLWAVPAGQRAGRVARRLLWRSVLANVLLGGACVGLVATTALVAL